MLTLDNVAKIVTKAMLKANKTYWNMSDKMTLHDHGIEQVASYIIAQELRKAECRDGGTGWATLETSFKSLKEWSGANRKRGRLNSALDKNGRVDVAFFDRNDALKGVVEVKRHLSYSNLAHDFARVRALLRAHGKRYDGTLRWGCVTGFHTEWAENIRTRKSFETRVDEIKSAIQVEFPDLVVRSSKKEERLPAPEKFEDDDGSPICLVGFAASSFLITLKRD
jgi:hypothetical protein